MRNNWIEFIDSIVINQDYDIFERILMRLMRYTIQYIRDKLFLIIIFKNICKNIVCDWNITTSIMRVDLQLMIYNN